MNKTFHRFLSSLSVCLALLLSGTPACGFTFQFDQIYRDSAIKIAAELNEKHYKKLTYNAQFEGQLLDSYVNMLDPSHIIFLQEDINRFAALKPDMTATLVNGKMLPVEEIYTTYQSRYKQLLEHSLANINQYDGKYRDTTAVIEIDRKQSPWPVDVKESQDLWDRHLFNEAIVLNSSSKNTEAPSVVLKRRYEHRLNHLLSSDQDEIFDIYINALTRLYDPHTDWMSPKAMQNFKTSMSLTLEGIGAVLQMENDRTKISSLINGGPASKSGLLKPGEFIIGVAQGDTGDFEDIIGWRLDEVVQKIKGPKGSTVRLKVTNTTQSDSRIVKLTRDKIKLEDEAAKMATMPLAPLSNELVGIINLPSFYLDTTNDVAKLLIQLKQKNIKGLIIDLRNNGGGSLEQVKLLAGLFINEGPVVLIRNSEGQIDNSLRATGHLLYDGPLIVLTNHQSASASEIFAGVIQDYQRGLIIGEQTFGKGTVQTVDGDVGLGQLKYTTAKFYRVTGESTQHKGVNPDISFPSLIDFTTIGESSLDNALPWDTINAEEHRDYQLVKPYLFQLSKQHEARMESSYDYKFLLQKIKLLTEFRKTKSLSLNPEFRKSQLETENKKLLMITNNFRKSKGLSPFANYSELEKNEAEESSKTLGSVTIDPENDFILREGVAIMKDYIADLNKIDGGITLK